MLVPPEGIELVCFLSQGMFKLFKVCISLLWFCFFCVNGYLIGEQ
jgi:hypothetical protein